MECPSCKADIPEASRFCDECGAEVPARCPWCGATNRAGAKFCSSCGGKLTASGFAKAGSIPFLAPAPPPTGATSAAERRQLTVMFCDLVGSTALAARLDPEDLREVIGAYHRCVAETVAGFDGFVAKYMGDGVLAYFGYPQAHEDDAERAVRAGLAIIDGVGQLRSPEDRLRVRVGIATGLVVVGDLVDQGDVRERAVVGETPNLAARLQALAGPDAVVIAASTHRLLGALFEYVDLGVVEAKGFVKPVQAWQVLGESGVESRFEALHSSTMWTPLVGREEQTELMLGRWRQAKEGNGRVVLLSGEPGIGKSRLAAAIKERLQAEPHNRLSYFCSPHHQDSALHPVIVQLERAAGFEREDTPEKKLSKLEALLGPKTLPEEDAALLAELLSIPTVGRYPPLNLTPQRKKEKTYQALLWELDSLARRQPVLIVFEDVHWIDPSSRELLDLIVERVRHLPVLVLVTFRPEFSAPWIGQAHVTMLTLNRLDHADGVALVEWVIGQRTVLPGEIVEAIVERTDGVPLFLEELTEAVLEAEARENNAASCALPPPAFAIPSTLHGSLMARLDRLGAAAREIAQAGAAAGREFAYELLHAIAPRTEAEVRNALDRLVGAGLLFQRGAPPQASYSFKHTLVQDAAYSTLLRSARQLLHTRIAAVLEEGFQKTADTQPELLAHHFTEAGLPEKAIPYLRRAGERASERSANQEAVRHFSKALDLLGSLPPAPQRLQQELALRVAVAATLIAIKGYAAPEVETAYREARDLCNRLDRPADLFPALRGLWNCYFVRGEVQRACDLASQLARLADEHEQPLWRALSRRALGASLFFRGDLGMALQQLEDGIRFSDAVGDTESAASGLAVYSEHPGIVCRLYVGRVLWFLGFPDRALARVEQGLAMARTLSHTHMTAFALVFSAVAHLLRREHGAALRRAGEAIALTTEHGLPQWRALGLVCRGFARAGLGQSAEGIADLRAGLAAWSETGANMGNSEWLSFLATAHARAGQVEEALAALDWAEKRVTSAGEGFVEAELRRLRGELAAESGVAAAGDGELWLRKAVERARQQGAKSLELRAATSLARLCRDQGKYAEARDFLAPVYSWFTEGFYTQDLKEARALLDELCQS